VKPGTSLHVLARYSASLLVIACLTLPGWTQQPHPLPIPTVCSQGPPGPPPCKDSDGDGLCDSWEQAQRVPGGPALPDADPNRPDIYLKYDYMVASDHDHNPPAKAIQWMVDAFAAHGIALHIDPEHAAIPEALVTTLDPNPAPACVGSSYVTMQTLRQQYFGNRAGAYHYMVFGHHTTCPDDSHCGQCPTDPFGGAKPDPHSTGSSDLPGDDAIVSFGAITDAGTPVGIELWVATIMHELGHNLGLQHGGSELVNYKPNYISVMNYAYQANGIVVGVAPGSTTFAACSTDRECGPPVLTTGACATPNACHCTDDLAPVIGTNVCFRADYSGLSLPPLNEFSSAPGIGGLDETAGVSGPATGTDLVFYWIPGPSELIGPSFGPIDWNGDGLIESHVTADINNDGEFTVLTSQNDWEKAGGLFTHLNFKFQCADVDPASPKPVVVNERSPSKPARHPLAPQP